MPQSRHNRRMFFNLPTLLTWARIVAIPLIVGVFYLDLAPAQRNLLATVLFVVVALTDWADGYLARRLNMTSSFGAFLDPVADKFLVCAALLSAGIGTSAWQWRQAVRWRAGWPVWAEQVAASDRDPRTPLQIWPQGWTMQLVPRRMP